MTNQTPNSLISSPQTSLGNLQAQNSNQPPNVVALAPQGGPSQSPLAVATIDAQRKARLAGPSSKKVKFTKAEDAKLAMLVAEYSDNDWKTIAEHMSPRTARQCRERWTNYVNPSLSKDPWTPEEDLLLIEKHKEFGNHWKIIERYFNNRSKNNIKHRWASMKESYPNNSSITTSPSSVPLPDSTTAPINPSPQGTASPFPVSGSDIQTNSPSTEQSIPPSNPNISVGKRANRKKSANASSLISSSNIVATLAAAKSNKANSSQVVTIPQINKIPQPVVNVVLHQQSLEPSVIEQSQIGFNIQNQANPMSFPAQMPFLDSGAGGMGRNGGYGMSTGIGGVTDFIGDVDVDTIREGDVSSYATLDPFQFFDRILDQHEVYVQSMDKTDFWSIPEENYF